MLLEVGAQRVLLYLEGVIQRHRLHIAILGLRAHRLGQIDTFLHQLAVWGDIQLPLAELVHLALLLAHHTTIGKGPVDLGVEVVAVSQHQKGKVTAELAVHLAGEHHHRIALARALGVPEDPQLAVARLALAHRFDGAVDAKKLVVAGDDLLRLAGGLIEQNEVLH